LGYFGGPLYVNAEAGTRQTSRCIHSRSSHLCIYTPILVPPSFNQTPLGCRPSCLCFFNQLCPVLLRLPASIHSWMPVNQLM